MEKRKWLAAEELRSVYEMVTCGYDYWPSRLAPRAIRRTFFRGFDGPVPLTELWIVEGPTLKENPKCSNTTDH